MRDTAIEWTDASWNTGDGCEVISPGCANCYAMRIAGRFSGAGRPYEGLVTIGKNKRAIWNGHTRWHPERLVQPLSWREPRLIFVHSTSDLFHGGFTNEQIAAEFGIMAIARWHTFQVLTKRVDRAAEWFRWIENKPTGLLTLPKSARLVAHVEAGRALEDAGVTFRGRPYTLGTVNDPRDWPMRNVWIGASVEDRKHGVPRIELLRQIPAQVRFLSIEPLLEDLGELDLTGIHWAIIGCESGPGARRCDPTWVRSIIRQCRAAKVPMFVKQLVEATNLGQRMTDGAAVVTAGAGSTIKGAGLIGAPYIDGEQHLDFPTPRCL